MPLPRFFSFRCHFLVNKKKHYEELNDDCKALKDSGYPSILSTPHGSHLYASLSKKGKYAGNRKMENEFSDFLKNGEYNIGNQDYIFSSYLSIYQSRTRYRRDWDSNPSKLKSLFQNEWDFWPFSALSERKEQEGVRGGMGTKTQNSPMGHQI